MTVTRRLPSVHSIGVEGQRIVEMIFVLDDTTSPIDTYTFIFTERTAASFPIVEVHPGAYVSAGELPGSIDERPCDALWMRVYKEFCAKLAVMDWQFAELRRAYAPPTAH